MTASIRGHFLWHELLTSDPEAAKTFYQKVVGWKTLPWTDPSYSVWMMGSTPMGGLMALLPEMKAAGLPPHWKTFIGTDNVDETVRHAERLGGRVVNPATDLPDVGRFAIIEDPHGAAFTAFTPGAPMMPTYPAPLGGFVWHELATLDWEAAWAFYSTLFGWKKSDAMDMGPAGIYQMFELGGVMLGGIYNKPPELPAPAWLPYAKVKDAKRSAAAMTAAGGAVRVGPMAVPGGTWIVMAIDPQGAAFAVAADGVVPAVKKAVPKKTAKRAAVKKSPKKAAAKKPPAKKPAAKRKAAKKPKRGKQAARRR